MTTVQYLRPDGERITETVRAVKLGDVFVQWYDDERDLLVMVPWNRVLIVEQSNVVLAGNGPTRPLVETGPTTHDDMFPIR